MSNIFFWLWFDELAKKHPWLGLLIALGLLILFAVGAYLAYRWSAGFPAVAVCGVAVVVEMAAVRRHTRRIVNPRRRVRSR